MPDGVNYLLRVFCKNSKLCSNQATQNPVWLALFLKLKKFFKKSHSFLVPIFIIVPCRLDCSGRTSLPSDSLL